VVQIIFKTPIKPALWEIRRIKEKERRVEMSLYISPPVAMYNIGGNYRRPAFL